MRRRAFALAPLAAGLAVALSQALAGCPGPAPPDGSDIFRVAVNGAPGGSLLAAWGSPLSTSATVYLAGGFVGVDPARLAGTDYSAGRLVDFASGRFTTRCRADHVLWWVHGVLAPPSHTDEVWAVGEGGAVVRLRGGACETLALGITFPEGPPTFYGVWARRPDDVWLVGGSAQPTGPKGVLVHYDGRTFTRFEGLPEAARGENLYKITRYGGDDPAASGYVIVGSNGTVLRFDGTTATAVDAGVPGGDNRLFTVSCSDAFCAAVGGSATGVILVSTGSPSALRTTDVLSAPSAGLNGVFTPDGANVFIVGTGGFTMHVIRSGPGYFRSYQAPRRTEATLHGVGGTPLVVLAVGGELDERTPRQRGIVLVRGDESASYTFDGQIYNAAGSIRRSLGGSGQ